VQSLPFHLEPISTTQYIVMGDVVMAEGVAIAPGVLFQADAGSVIVIGAGVCVGMGCVIHACGGGDVTIGPGVSLGAGVLVVGKATIGAGAVVGSGTTIFDQSVVANALVPPSSLLIGVAPVTPEPVIPEPTPSVNVTQNGYFYSKGNETPVETPIADPWATPTSTPTSNYVYPDANLLPKHAWQTSASADLGDATHFSAENFGTVIGQAPIGHVSIVPVTPEPVKPKQVYGQDYVNRMLGRMGNK
jgi:carbon dioxide concentrating mechanism protein CcmN